MNYSKKNIIFILFALLVLSACQNQAELTMERWIQYYEWNKFDTIVGDNKYINDLKISKFLKHGIFSLIRNPSALIKAKRNIRFHFDMWHGNGNLDKAISALDIKDREDFRKYIKQNVSFSKGNIFFCRSKNIINKYY